VDSITVRIAHARPWPGKIGDRRLLIVGYLVVLAADAAHRAVPVWLLPGNRAGGSSLPRLVNEPDGVTVTARVPEELGARLLHAAGASVTGVDIEMIKADAGELRGADKAGRSGRTRAGHGAPGRRHCRRDRDRRSASGG
jgi:hypothetical protein